MRASGAKGVAGGNGRRLRLGVFFFALYLIPGGRAAADPCQVIADSIASQKVWEAHGIVNIETGAGNVRGIDEIRQSLEAVDPAIVAAMTPAIESKPGAVGWWLSQADIDGDGSPEWWLKSNQGSLYCETSWFYRSTPPYPFVGRRGSLDTEEALCGFHVEPVTIEGNTYVLEIDYGAELRNRRYDVFRWQAPDTFKPVCRVTTEFTDEFTTKTDCIDAEQPVCDAVAALAAPLIRTDDTPLAGAIVDDETILSTFSFRKAPDTLVQYADIDNDGVDEIFATESSRSSPFFRFDDFRFDILRTESNGFQPIDPDEAYAGFKEVLDPYDYNRSGYYGTRLVALFPVRIGDRTFLVERKRADRDDPGDFILRILILENGRLGGVGTVYATPVLRGSIERLN